MQIKRFESLPQEARMIRETVFVLEQGFTEEFDSTDSRAVHFVAFEGTQPVAVCRYYFDPERDCHVIGRIAVLKPFRSRGIGALLMRAAQDDMRRAGIRRVMLHAQSGACGFYKKQGYRETGPPDEEEGCPHVWMSRQL